MVQLLTKQQFISNSEAVLVDVRTPKEYQSGHIPGAVNLPLFTDDERIEVGTLYKQVGKEAAVLRGLEMVGPKLSWFVTQAKEMSQGKSLYLYCWRGGMRSGSMAWLLDTAGFAVGQLVGGYKAYRSTFDDLLALPWKFVVLTGKTGCGKTDILRAMQQQGEQVLDLEGLANHRGSAFGAIGLGQQPTTEEFINRIHHTLKHFTPDRPVWCEGESMMIGHVFIPTMLFSLLQCAPQIDLDMLISLRVERLVKEYGGYDKTLLVAAFKQIRKRLGDENTNEALAALAGGKIDVAAEKALCYYDKGYAKATQKRKGKQIGRLVAHQDNPTKTAKQLIALYHEHQDR